MSWGRVNHSEQWLSIGETARLLDIHPETVRQWYEKGILKGHRVRGDRGARRIDRSSVEAILEARGYDES